MTKDSPVFIMIIGLLWDENKMVGGINMRYKKNQEKTLDKALFSNPTKEYRGAPFWAWNGKLEQKELLDQIRIFQKMGMGGFHMHVRTGLDTAYLTDDFFDYIKACIQEAKDKDLLAYLYDEDRWPSGAAGGLVTRDHPEYASKNLLFTAVPYSGEARERETSEAGYGRGGLRQENGVLLGIYDVLLDAEGCLASYRYLEPEQAQEVPCQEGAVRWYAYLEHGSADPWFNDAPYVDTLSPEAVQKFLQVTHETYARQIGEDFGSTVPSIFTDEPQFNTKTTLGFAGEKADVFLPWTTDFAKTYGQAYGEDPLNTLPELIWELPDNRVSVHRYRYHNHIADRFVQAFCVQSSEWCRRHHLSLAGHVIAEESLHSQTSVLGEAMRCYRYFGIPGIDMLCDRREYTTAKQAQSIVHQMGAEAMLSELYGVTGWDCDFRTYKLQGDWQAALGVNLRVPHLTWMTMKGEAKRDYPASIGYQSPWYDQFSMIEDHFARLNTAMTRGVPDVKVGVIHPIESYWLHFGPSEQTAPAREHLEEQFQQLAELLLFHQIDFDYISENELPHFCPQGGNPLRVGQMAYDAVIVCGCQTLRETTVERLSAFAKAGGDLIFVGEYPCWMDLETAEALETLKKQGRQVPFGEISVMKALAPHSFLEIRRPDGRFEKRLIHQLRTDGQDKWLFVAMGVKPECLDVDDAKALRFVVKGEWKLTRYDTLTGKTAQVEAAYENGNTVFSRVWHMHDSLLLKLEPGRSGYRESEPDVRLLDWRMGDVLFGTVQAEMEEPNLYLLDMAEYSLDGGPMFPEEEILRIDNIARKELGIPLRRKEVTQPYLVQPEKPEHFVTLRFRIFSETAISDPMLALEDWESSRIRWNGALITEKPVGWYVDHCIQKVPLPELKPGENLLEITVPMGSRTNLENFYLLGDFGVRVKGTDKRVTAPVRRLGFGDITSQGLPFYTGNLLYHFDVETGDEPLHIRIPKWRGGLVKVFVDHKDRGNVAFSPYQIDIEGLKPGIHPVTLRLYGTRWNGFGQIHHTPGIWYYQSPNSFRSEGTRWSYEYQLKPAGILGTPEIYGGYGVCRDGSTRKVVVGKAFGVAEIDPG